MSSLFKWLVSAVIIIIFAAGISFFGGFFSGQPSAPENNGKPTEEEAELAGYGFILDFILTAPPASDESAQNRIFEVLSENAKGKIGRETISSDLAGFVGVQDVPDQGASVEDLQIVSDNEAYLVVGLNYSGGRQIRNVYLVVENGKWKVDRVTAPAQINVFEKGGNLIKNNPGMDENVWYLSYEEPGQPALSVKLQFVSSSLCIAGNENSICNENLLEQGARVNLSGELVQEGLVRVITLEVE